jgi:histidine triad (HIT) family protein
MGMEECVFCRIVRGEIPATVVHQDELAVAFRDVRPQAPTHVLVVPRRHVASLAETTGEDAPLLGHLLALAAELARRLGLASGYRVVVNTGPQGGQTVPHLHLHLLGGRAMAWPPG